MTLLNHCLYLASKILCGQPSRFIELEFAPQIYAVCVDRILRSLPLFVRLKSDLDLGVRFISVLPCVYN